ncbi:MBL fold metallo-hydrolase RNA specificity domain-containing protein [Pontibacter pamirensis]|uniref:MBL fold metallo-hydrolase RNA specificity domain-containing protein n=1 Tax=Pontibacter pamirensis TaxID=2562824 RepID=UPI00138A52B3
MSHIGSLSAHAEQGDLLWWFGHFKETPKQIFLIHGEKGATEALKKKVGDTYDCAVTATELDKVYKL